jgi:hypothetical protein
VRSEAVTRGAGILPAFFKPAGWKPAPQTQTRAGPAGAGLSFRVPTVACDVGARNPSGEIPRCTRNDRLAS